MRWSDLRPGDVVHFATNSYLVVNRAGAAGPKVVMTILDLDTGEASHHVGASNDYALVGSHLIEKAARG